jgi:two-component system phosphate regulon response regulator PhoB
MSARPPGDGCHVVLVAEDDPVTAKVLLHRLSNEPGLRVVHADDGTAALALAQREPLDAAILDIRLPGLDGLGVLARLREIPRYERLPILMLTSLGSETDVVRGFELGADDYVVKPFSPAELIARVRRLLARGEAYHGAG